MAYKKDYQTYRKDPEAQPEKATPPEPPRPPVKPPPPASAREIDDLLMGAPKEAGQNKPGLPPDPEDLISHLPLQRYVQSGKYSLGGAITTIIIGAMAVGIFGALYGWASFSVASALMGFPICLLYGFVTAVALYLASQAGRLRSATAAFFTGLIVTVLGWYASWWVYTWLAADTGMVPYFNPDPATVLSNLLTLADQGRHLFGKTWHYGVGVTGATWLVEGLFMVFGPALLNQGILASTPFCERCGKWVDVESYKFKAGPTEDLEQFRKDVVRLGPETIAALTTPQPDHWIEVSACVCPLCQKVGFLTTVAMNRVNNPRPTAINIDNNLEMRGRELRGMKELYEAARNAGHATAPVTKPNPTVNKSKG